jgi:hypothetical protein
MLLTDVAAGRLPATDPNVLHPAASKDGAIKISPQIPLDQQSHWIGRFARWLA